jgi:hypothetical protein
MQFKLFAFAALETITVNDNLGKKANGLRLSRRANLIEIA